MHRDEALPRVTPDTLIKDAIYVMSAGRLGMTTVCDDQMKLCGIVTDGDLRRLVERGLDLRSLAARDVMHPRPHLISHDALAVDAADLMERHRVTSLLVVDADGLLTGAINSNDLMRAKVI